MHWRPVTKVILIVTAVVWAVYDFIPFFNPDRGDTISEVMLYYALRSFSLPYAFGVLCGHFFFPHDPPKQRPKILISITLAVIAYDVVAHVFNVSVMLCPQAYPFVPFLVGIPIGALLWQQSKDDKMQDECPKEDGGCPPQV